MAPPIASFKPCNHAHCLFHSPPKRELQIPWPRPLAISGHAQSSPLTKATPPNRSLLLTPHRSPVWLHLLPAGVQRLSRWRSQEGIRASIPRRFILSTEKVLLCEFRGVHPTEGQVPRSRDSANLSLTPALSENDLFQSISKDDLEQRHLG